VRLGELRIELERAPIQIDRIALLAGVLREHAEVVVRGRLRRIELDRALEALARRIRIVALGEQPPEVDPRLGALRTEPQ